jgi:hypothetical protein
MSHSITQPAPVIPPLDWEESSEELDPNYAWTCQTGGHLYAVSYPVPFYVSPPPAGYDPSTPWCLEVIPDELADEIAHVATSDDMSWYDSAEAAKAAAAVHCHQIDPENAIDQIYAVLDYARQHGTEYEHETFDEIASIVGRTVFS